MKRTHSSWKRVYLTGVWILLWPLFALLVLILGVRSFQKLGYALSKTGHDLVSHYDW